MVFGEMLLTAKRQVALWTRPVRLVTLMHVQRIFCGEPAIAAWATEIVQFVAVLFESSI